MQGQKFFHAGHPNKMKNSPHVVPHAATQSANEGFGRRRNHESKKKPQPIDTGGGDLKTETDLSGFRLFEFAILQAGPVFIEILADLPGQ